MEELNEFMNSLRFTVFDPVRIKNLYFNAKVANKIVYTGKFFEITFANKGKRNTECIFCIPIVKLSENYIQGLMHLIHKNKKPQPRKNEKSND